MTRDASMFLASVCAVYPVERLAELERELIRARTTEGRARAVARGVKLGRKPKLTPHQREGILRRRESGEAVRETARSYNVHNSTISRLTYRHDGRIGRSSRESRLSGA
jgi:DNA invertase Pin-like site-specific DNA recombinase